MLAFFFCYLMQNRNPAVHICLVLAVLALLCSYCVLDLRRRLNLPNICSIDVNINIRLEGCKSIGQTTEAHTDKVLQLKAADYKDSWIHGNDRNSPVTFAFVFSDLTYM